MTREEFLDLYFDEAIDFINESDAGNELFSIDTAGEMIKDWIDQGEWLLADHILHFIANESSGDYFIWDAGSGTFSNPRDVSEVDDLEDLADEYGLLESFRRKKTVKENRIMNNGCIAMRESNDTESSPKQLFNKIVSKLRKYAKEHGCYMTIEKFGATDNSGNAYLYFTTNRYAISGSVQFTFKLDMEKVKEVIGEPIFL